MKSYILISNCFSISKLFSLHKAGKPFVFKSIYYRLISNPNVCKKTRHSRILLSGIYCLRNKNLIIPESMMQDFGFTSVLGKQTRSRLRNCFLERLWSQKKHHSCVGRNKSDSGVIEFSFIVCMKP